ncbi:MAG: cytochrome d ubiquinol oxidase subunit II [Solirubrobacteraceae bacterium]
MSWLQTLWFVLICVLWTGYLVLEGFDFGAGALLRVVGRDGDERRAIINSFGPVWDGNEVWLLVAGGATFAAFPEWYATLFSGFYLALFVLLVALILRNVAIEFWGKHDSARWRSGWEWALSGGSVVAALLLGVAWANIARGVPLTARGEYAGTFWTLLNPYSLLGGVTSLVLFGAHGAHFLTLRTHGAVHERAAAAARALAPAAVAVVAAFAVWTIVDAGEVATTLLAVLSVAAAGGAWLRARAGREGWAFALSALTIVALFCALFAWLYPNALPSTGPGSDLTLAEASSSHYTLSVMTVVAAVFTPLVLAYQAWTYWVFRRRVGAEDYRPAEATPLDALGRPGETAEAG